MDANYYIDLAKQGKRMPIATHLVLHEKPDPEAILVDGARLGEVMLETARRFGNPMALPVMDLTLEKDVLLRKIGIPAEDIEAYHFDAIPDAATIARAKAPVDVLQFPRIRANCEALSRIGAGGEVLPVGMSIGPFSLLTKLVHDPITAIYMAGTGMTAEDDDDVALITTLLDLAEAVIHETCLAQIKAGARAIFLCEPAANLVYFSPKQLREGSTVYDEFVIQPNLRLKALFDETGTDLLFHDCGELIPEMISSFNQLRPRVISFGSPVKLWEVEPYVDKDIVLFGNLPTKKFYSDEDVPLDGVAELVQEIDAKLAASGHPYIVGSECDVLAMPGYEQRILEKVQAMCGCGCAHEGSTD